MLQMAPRVAPLAAEAISAAEGSAVVVGGTAVASAVASAAATLGITKRAEKEQQVGRCGCCVLGWAERVVGARAGRRSSVYLLPAVMTASPLCCC